MRISVILPAYNEAETIGSIIEDIYTALSKGCEIIVVDDGSADATARVAAASGAQVLSNPYNMGNGASIKRGIRSASGDVIVLMDADGQHVPADIPKLLTGIDAHDMIIGCRTKKSGPAWRLVANTIYNMLASYVSGVKINDLTSGFRAMKKETVQKFLYLLPNTFSYPTTLTLSFVRAGFPISFVPIAATTRRKGKSKINVVTDGIRFLVIILRICVFFSPLKIFIPVSALFLMTGVLYYLYTYINFNRFTNMSALLFTASILTFMLGLISEQIAALRMERIDER